MVLRGFLDTSRLLSMLGGLFIISAALMYMAHMQNHRYLKYASGLLFTIIFFDIFINYSGVVHTDFQSNLVLNIFFQSLGSIAIIVLVAAIFNEITTIRKLKEIKIAAFDVNEVIYFEFSRNTRMFSIECSDQFVSTYALNSKIYHMTMDEVSKCIIFEEDIQLKMLNHQNIHSIEHTVIQVKLPEMKFPIFMSVNGVFVHVDKIIFITVDIDLLKNSLSLVDRLNRERARMLEHLNVGIAEAELIYDQDQAIDFKYIYVNQAFETIIHATKDELIGKLNSEVFKERKSIHIPLYQEVVESDSVTQFNYQDPIYKTWYHVTVYKSSNQRFVTVMHDITETKKLHDEQKYQIDHDTFTGLLNDRGLYKALNDAKHCRLAVCFFLDIKDFLAIVDFHGIEVGDYIIKEISSYFKMFDYKDKLLSRFGNDLFVMILINPSQDVIFKATEYMNRFSFVEYEINDINLQVKHHIGSATYPEHTDDLKEIVPLASMASKQASLSIHHTVYFYHEQLKLSKQNDLKLARLLKQAIEEKRIMVYFQKIIDVRNQSIYAMESLSRWYDEKLGYVPPDQFFKIARDYSLIEMLETYVIKQSISTFSQWIKSAKEINTQLSINLSPEVFTSEKQAMLIKDIANRYGILTKQIIIEVSEKVFVNQTSLCQEAILRYKDLGFQIAIDDFGSEYSSLSILDKVDYDVIKIDGSFIQRLRLKQNQEIVEMIVKIAKMFKRRVVAEAVESIEDAKYLTSIDCFLHQGFYYHLPEHYPIKK